jgi:putative DNA primase/helicase
MTVADESAKSLPDGFRHNERGAIEYRVARKDDEDERWEWLCSPLEIMAETRDADEKDWGLLVRIKARGGAGIWHTQIVKQSLCVAESGEMFALLASLGLKITPAKGGKDRLRALLSLASPGKLVRLASRIGWHGDNTFVLPDEAFGALSGEPIVFQMEHPVMHNYRRKGTFEGWRNEVAARAAGNSRLIFGLSAAFAGPFLQPLNVEGGGFHLRGDSSTGKSTAFTWMGGSVWGGGSLAGFGQIWRGTDNGVESRAVLYSNTAMPLDELGMVSAAAASRIVYFLANGMGKARAGIAGEARPIAEFRILFLSSGEISLAVKLAEDGQKTMAGQEVRFIDLEADAGAGMGTFENTYGAAPNEFADIIQGACKAHYGHAAREFLKRLLADREAAMSEAKHLMGVFTHRFCPKQPAAQVSRTATRFALVAAAGEIATLWNILPWPSGTAMDAAGRMFREWHERRGTPGALEGARALEQVRAMIEKHGASRFVPVDETLRPLAPSTPVNNRLGYVRRAGDDDGGEVFYVLPEMFKNEICKGLDAARVAKELIRADALIPGKDGKSSQSIRFPGLGQKRLYVVDGIKLSANEAAD